MKQTALIAMIFSVTASLSAFESRIVDEEISSLLNTYDKTTLTEISNELVKMAAKEETQGEFDMASVHYARALKIREMIGLKNHKSYASILYLSSSAQFNAGYICDASTSAKEASFRFGTHGLVKFQEKAANDHLVYGKACGLMALK